MKNRVLVLAPHTDDGEFGCGGSMAKLIEDGAEVFYAVFSHAVKSVPKGFKETVLLDEMHDALEVIGVNKKNIIPFDYPVRDFPLHRQNILENLIVLDRDIKPDMVFLPSIHDIHQDHSTIAQEGYRAFKKKTMLGYEMPWNNLTINTTCFILLEQRHIDLKIRACKCYKSQTQRPYAQNDFIQGLARTRGIQIGASLAEVFEVNRWVIN